MSYLGFKALNEYLTFYSNTKSPTTGNESDATGAPTYRIYEEDTDTPILTGNTAKIDDAGTTGFYGKKIQILAASGFESGKCYGVRTTGTVGGVTDSKVDTFTVIDPASVADIWTEPVPGAFPSGSAGKVLGDGVVTIGAVNAAAIDEAAFAADTAKYQMKIGVTLDSGGAADRYTIAFFTNGEPIYGGITSPTLQVVKDADGSDLIATTALTQIAATGVFKYTATTTSRITAGAAYFAKVSATINGNIRTWLQFIGRDA